MAEVMNPVGVLHKHLVFGRRVRRITSHLSSLLPHRAGILDVGCGDGTIDRLLLEERRDLEVVGIDIAVRAHASIDVSLFDGHRIPFPDRSFDIVMFIDVLHHAEDPGRLLAEARRVARQAIVLKDHTREGFLAGLTLRAMDWVGNAPHHVSLPYNYWTVTQWREAFKNLQLTADYWATNLGLYPWPASVLFDRSLHFIARLRVPADSAPV